MSAVTVLTTDDVARKATERLTVLQLRAQGYLDMAKAEANRIVPTQPWSPLINALLPDVYGVRELSNLCFGAHDLEAGERIHDAVMHAAEALIDMAHAARLASVGRASAKTQEAQQ